MFLLPYHKQGPLSIHNVVSDPRCCLILLLHLYSTLLPQMKRATDKTRPGGPLRDFHPSEVLSELSPLRAAVAGQGYHDRRMRSSQHSLPRLLWDRLVPLCTLSSSFIYGFLRKFPLSGLRRWSSRFFRIAFPGWAHPLMLFCHRL